MSNEEQIENYRVFRTYSAVAGVIVVALLNHFKLISDELAAQLVGIFLALAVAAMRYGQVQAAAQVKQELKKQQAVVKAAFDAAERNEGSKPCDPTDSPSSGLVPPLVSKLSRSPKFKSGKKLLD